MARQRSVISTGDLDKEQPVNMGIDGFTTPPELNAGEFDISDIEIVKEERAKAKIKDAAFMREKILIQIEPRDVEDPPRFEMLGHNGTSQWVEVGKPQTVARRFLVSAIAARKVSLAVSHGVRDGAQYNNRTATAARTLKAELLEDRNPNGGMAWVRRVAEQYA